jgi:pyridoxal biosynthesis lyase PdxS
VNELIRVEQPAADVRAYQASTEAASICKQIVLATSKPIQGRNFVSVEGWQAIAVAHGCALSAHGVEKVDGGIRAIGEVRRMSDGQLIATGEGFVGEDEATWYGGKVRGRELPKRNDYAIRAMAQTRAMSRAGRTAFAHVVVMMDAGLATTPAEEMVTIDGETGEIIEGTPTREKVPGIHKIKERLGKLRTAGEAATDLETFTALLKEHKDDLKTIRDANHEWWTGDGEDFEGYGAWKERRKAELTPQPQSTEFQFLASLVSESTTAEQLQGVINTHGDAVGMLDGAEARKFEAMYDAKVEALKSPTPMTAGAFGG